MRAKHLHVFLPTFAATIIFLLGLFVLAGSQASASEGYKGKGSHTEWQKQKEYNKESQKDARVTRREAPRHSRDVRDRRDYNNRHDYYQHHGYREGPYDRHRQYRHHEYMGHRYNYQGHWRSWDQWDRYAKKHPEIHRHGEYYRENEHLMFRFCDPITGNCVFFSIGR